MTDLNHWYIKKGRGQIQQSWYLLFIKRKKIKVDTLITLMDKWGEMRMFTLNWKGSESQRKTTMDNISSNWQEFLAFVTSETGIQFNKRPYKKRHKDYDDWWQEQNMNGGFAYNGVTDDF